MFKKLLERALIRKHIGIGLRRSQGGFVGFPPLRRSGRSRSSTVFVASVGNASGTEGATLAHTVTLSGATTAQTSFAFTLAGNTATAGVDFSTTLTFTNGVTQSGSFLIVPAGVSSFAVNVVTTDDAAAESSETYTLTVGGQIGMGTILDNDTGGGGGGLTGLRWSDPDTWGGSLPTSSDPVVIPAGQTFILDVPNAVAQSVEVAGTLIADPAIATVGLTAEWVRVEPTGTLRVGESGSRFPGRATFTYNGSEVGRVTAFRPDVIGTSGTGNGTLRRLWSSSGAVNETITVTFTSATAFTVAGSVSGSLGSGTVGTLFNNRVRFVATAGSTAWAAGATVTIRMQSKAFANNGVPRSLQVMPGGKLYLYGKVKASNIRVSAHIADGATSATLESTPTGWEVGDEIVIGPTDFADTTSGVPLKRTITNIVGNVVTWDTPITGFRWGLLQYATDAGMSLTPGTLTRPASWPSLDGWTATPKVLDERAVIMNVTRNVVVQGADDAAWSSSGFGAHTMVMGLASDAHFDSVEFKRMGQAGAIGRYPLHWHVLSYNMPDGMALPSDGTFLGAADPAKHFVRNCSVNGSSQRGLVLHGTHGVLADNNCFFDVTGHCIFLEDHAEELNAITNNTVMLVKLPSAANELVLSERDMPMGQSSGIWFSNPNNTLTGNKVFAARTGIWNSIAARRCIGLLADVALIPDERPVLAHANNIAACNWVKGMLTDAPARDNLGDASLTAFFGEPEDGQPFIFASNQVWKNTPVGYNNRVFASQEGLPESKYTGWTSADNETLDFSGQASPQVPMERTLMVGVSLNNGNNAEARADNGRRAGFVTYDEAFVPREVIALHYKVRTPPTFSRDVFNGQARGIQGGGLLRGGEYVQSLWTLYGYHSWKMVDCNPCWMVTPPFKDGQGNLQLNELHSLSPMKDEGGLLTGVVNRHIVYNDPFYTHNAANVQPWTHAAAVTTDTQHIGVAATGSVSGIPDGNFFQPRYPFFVDRLDGSGNVVGTWNVPDARAGGFALAWFRHFAAARGGIYRVGFNGELPSPGDGGATYVRLEISLLDSAADEFTVGVAWPNGTPVQTVYMFNNAEFNNTATSWGAADVAASPPRAIIYNNTGMTSRATVVADTTGRKFWQDTTNNVVWIKVKGGQLDNPIRNHNYTGVRNRYSPFSLGVRSDVKP